MKTYSEKLRDPRWQRRRLEIMERDDFTCRGCGAKDKTLNIHHIRYLKGLEPWEYKEFYLVTLCESCHVEEEGILQSQSRRQTPGRKLKRIAYQENQTCVLTGFENQSEDDNRPPTEEELKSFFSLFKSEMQSITNENQNH